jgi:acyl dehydratase
MGGFYYEELEVGSVHEHAIRRTITESDNVLYNSLTLNLQRLYLDADHSAHGPWGKPLVNPLLTLSNVIGMHVPEMTAGTTHGNLGMSEMEFPTPVFAGDTLRSRTTVTSKRPSKSHPDSGVVVFLHEGLNQRDEVVLRCKRAGLMLNRPNRG